MSCCLSSRACGKAALLAHFVFEKRLFRCPACSSRAGVHLIGVGAAVEARDAARADLDLVLEDALLEVLVARAGVAVAAAHAGRRAARVHGVVVGVDASEPAVAGIARDLAARDVPAGATAPRGPAFARTAAVRAVDGGRRARTSGRAVVGIVAADAQLGFVVMGTVDLGDFGAVVDRSVGSVVRSVVVALVIVATAIVVGAFAVATLAGHLALAAARFTGALGQVDTQVAGACERLEAQLAPDAGSTNLAGLLVVLATTGRDQPQTSGQRVDRSHLAAVTPRHPDRSASARKKSR